LQRSEEVNIFLSSMGLGVYSVQLAQGLGEKDYVTIALEYIDANNLKHEFPAFFENARFESMVLPHYGFPNPRDISTFGRMYRKIITQKTDLIHVLLSSTYVESFLAMWLAHKTGIPLVATMHDSRLHPGDFISLRKAWLSFHVLGMCLQIIVHGRHMADDFIKVMGMDERTVNIVPHGNYDIYLEAGGRSLSPTPNSGRVLLFGRMKKYKGLDVLIQAAPIIAERVENFKIILAGRGPELDQFEPQLKYNPLFEVRNRYIPAHEAAELFSSSNLVVIPYIQASQSGPLHLAYTWGRPVVATKVGAIPESLVHGQEGFLVPPDDPKALAEAIVKILGNHALAVSMGEASRLKADNELNWKGYISEKTREVYRKAIGMRKKRISYPGIGAKARWKKVKAHLESLELDGEGKIPA
jgi:alpha-maltose-1-phosphate synthase